MVHKHAHLYANDARWQRIRKMLRYLRGRGSNPAASSVGVSAKPKGIKAAHNDAKERAGRLFGAQIKPYAGNWARYGGFPNRKPASTKNPTAALLALHRQKKSKQGRALFGKKKSAPVKSGMRKLGPRPSYA